MKIAYIVPALINKGPVIVVHNIVKNLVCLVDEVHVYYFDDDITLNFPCQTFQIKKGKAINFDRYDIIHSHGYRPDKYLYKFKKQIRYAKTISTIHADLAQDLKFSYNNLISFFFTPLWLFYTKRKDAVTVISEKLFNLYTSVFKEKMYRVYNGLDIELMKIKPNDSLLREIASLATKGYVICGTYAVLTKIKGIEQMINLLQIRKDLALVIIGEGKEKRELQNLVAKLKVSDRVLFYPYIQAPYNYTPFFDVYFMTSRSEGFGLALVEAALAKSAIVCSNLEVFKEIFNDTEVCYFELDNSASLSGAIDEAISTKQVKSINAYNRALSHFSSNIMAKNYLSVYEELLSNK